MSIVTDRITSNLQVHGIVYAVKQEVSRFTRKGMSRKAAEEAAYQHVMAAVRHHTGITRLEQRVGL